MNLVWPKICCLTANENVLLCIKYIYMTVLYPKNGLTQKKPLELSPF